MNGEYIYERDHRNSGMFFPNNTWGILHAKVLLLLNNHGYHLSLKNPFAFVGPSTGTGNSSVRVWIQNRSDRYFANLGKFRFINL